MAFNTGNSVPSSDAKDLYDNAQNLDSAVNSEALTFTDRLGNERSTWAGVEQRGLYWIGPSATEPTTRLNGDPLVEGDRYINTSDSLEYYWDGAQWLVNVVAELRADLADSTDPAKGAALVGRGVVAVASVSALSTITEDGRRVDLRYIVAGYGDGSTVGGGEFVWLASDLSAEVASDQYSAVYVPPSGQDGSLGAFVRLHRGEVDFSAFGWVGTDTSDNKARLQAAFNLTASLGASLTCRGGTCSVSAPGVTVPTGLNALFTGFNISAMSGYAEGERLLNFAGCDLARMEFESGSVVSMPQGEYTTGEQRHAFDFRECSNVEVITPVVNGTGGDAYYFYDATDCHLDRPVCLQSRRQGMSIVWADGLTVDSPVMTGASGTAPEAGIDIEPGDALGVLKRITINNPRCYGNAGSGLLIYLEKLNNAAYTDDIDITINNPYTESNAEHGISIERIYNATAAYGGHITINNPVSVEDGYCGIRVYSKDYRCANLRISSPVVVNPCKNGTAYNTLSGIIVGDSGLVEGGGIQITDATLSDEKGNMDYGVNFDLAQSLVETSVTVAECSGAVLSPISWGAGSTPNPSRAEICDVRLSVSAKLPESPRTAGFNTAKDDSGKIITNEGAVAPLTVNAYWYYPVGIPLRVQVVEPQQITVKPSDSADVIVGTSGAGLGVYSNTPGAYGELIFIGTYNGARHWRWMTTDPTWTYQ